MKRTSLNLFIMTTLVASVFLGPGSVLAKTPEPPAPTPAAPIPPGPEGKEPGPGGPRALSPAGVTGPSPSVLLGATGLSYRYTETFGQTGVAYLADNAHLNYPFGLGVDGTNVWIAELWGNRAMKYTSAGVFQQQVGIAGMGNTADTVLWQVSDVEKDSGGNIWVVDNSADHVAKFNSAGTFVSELGVVWEAGSDDSHFDTPASIAFDAGGNIYVSDGASWWSENYGNHRVQIFDSDGNHIGTIGTTGVAGSTNSHLHGPRHITIAGSYLYVADSGNHRVQIFNISTPASPAFVATLGTGASGSDNARFDTPSGVAVDANYIYVADTYHDRVQVFNATTRAYVTTIGTGWGTGDYEFEHPYDVAVDTAGNLYVADFANTRVQQFTRSGPVGSPTFTYARSYGATGVPYLTDDYHYNSPSGIAVGGDGSIYMTEDMGARLVKLSAAGVPLWTVGAAGVKGDWDESNDRLDNPGGVALDSSGRAYVADRYHGRVQIYTPGGAYYGTIGGLNCPGGVHFAPSGYLYVADPCDETVKIYDTGLNPVASIGVSGEWGSDDAHFDGPEDVVVDGSGNIYVADMYNHRVQVFDSSRAYVRTVGEAGVCRDDFDHLCGPNGLFVDGANRLYVADQWNNRVQVFDSSGAYLTTIGGSWGSKSSQMINATGVALDADGNVYVTDQDNHRILKFAPGVPDWSQQNINGFGNRFNQGVSSLEPFGGQLYAGTYNWTNGAELWRSSDGLAWSPVMAGGFGNSLNRAFDNLFVFGSNLYAGMWTCADAACNASTGGQIWRSGDGSTWDPIVSDGFGDAVNGEVYAFGEFAGDLYAATWSYDTSAHGTEIWRSDSGDAGTWGIVASDGFNGDSDNIAVLSFAALGGYLYAGTYNTNTGGEIWRTDNGTSWSQVNSNGFGDAGTIGVTSLTDFGGYLYASTRHVPGEGIEVWRCQVCDGSDWGKVVDNGFGDPTLRLESGLQVLGGMLYVASYSLDWGAEIWQTSDGSNWSQVGFSGFGDANNTVYSDKMEVFNNQLYVGTTNYGNGGEVWRLTRHAISGNAGAEGVTLSYSDDGAKTVTSTAGGNYAFTVPYDWSGTVTPSKTYYTFSPTSLSYDNVTSDQINQDYAATLHTFADVPVTGKEWMEPWIIAFKNAGITTGCGVGPLIYCPERKVTRAEMAVFILRAKHGLGWTPPAATGVFADVPVTGKEWMEPWIEAFFNEGITTGCGADPLIYCPEREVTRAEMAVFVLRAIHTLPYSPPAATHIFGDMPVAGKEWMEAWAEDFYAHGITTGCGLDPLRYCPENQTTRAEMAVFIDRAYGLYP